MPLWGTPYHPLMSSRTHSPQMPKNMAYWLLFTLVSSRSLDSDLKESKQEYKPAVDNNLPTLPSLLVACLRPPKCLSPMIIMAWGWLCCSPPHLCCSECGCGPFASAVSSSWPAPHAVRWSQPDLCSVWCASFVYVYELAPPPHVSSHDERSGCVYLKHLFFYSYTVQYTDCRV